MRKLIFPFFSLLKYIKMKVENWSTIYLTETHFNGLSENLMKIEILTKSLGIATDNYKKTNISGYLDNYLKKTNFRENLEKEN